jgi:formylmethanofuran dehydrogenase subunit D
VAPLVFKTSLGIVKVLGGFDSLPSPPSFAYDSRENTHHRTTADAECLHAMMTGPMAGKRFIMNAGRTTKQGQQINVGKDSPEYKAIVGTLTMHPEDMQEAGIQPGGSVRVRSDYGEVVFLCNAGKVPQGMIFVPYGPPTCHLMGQYTDGTGMPTSKGWEVEVEAIAPETAAPIGS